MLGYCPKLYRNRQGMYCHTSIAISKIVGCLLTITADTRKYLFEFHSPSRFGCFGGYHLLKVYATVLI